MGRKSRIAKAQLSLAFPEWGGKREGAGRKPAASSGTTSRVPHAARPELKARFPVHVVLRVVRGRPSLRERGAHHALLACFVKSANRFGMRVNEYSVQSNHIHLIVEADGTASLSKGMQGLNRRIAWALSRLWHRRGRVFADRYHATILQTPCQVKNTLRYVLHNARKHGSSFQGPDPFSSGEWFDGWNDYAPAIESRGSPLARATTWLQRIGWLEKHGPIPAR